MGIYGYHTYFYVPSYDVDLCWHTHMLVSTSAYLEETRIRAGVCVDHDDSVNQRQVGSKLNRSWLSTQRLWLEAYGDSVAPIGRRGCGYRGEPPDHWYVDRKFAGAYTQEAITVCDDFMSPSLREHLAAQLPISALGAEALVDDHSKDPFKAIQRFVQVPKSLHHRMLQVLGASSVAQAHCAALPDHPPDDDESAIDLPARASRWGVPLHEDRYGGYGGAAVGGLVAVVYISGGGSMTFVDKRSRAVLREVEIVPGRLVAWYALSTRPPPSLLAALVHGLPDSHRLVRTLSVAVHLALPLGTTRRCCIRWKRMARLVRC